MPKINEFDVPMWKRLADRVLLSTRFFTVREGTYELPSGIVSEFYTIDIPNWVQCIAFTPENEILLVRQYRHHFDDHLIELPAGIIEPGEDPLVACRRELLEETGYQAQDLHSLGSWACLTGRTTCEGATYYGQCTWAGTGQNLDTTEDIEVLKVSPSKLVQMIENGEIKSGSVVAAVYALKDRCRELFEK
jgi:ADP-ribose pyrophosphatase